MKSLCQRLRLRRAAHFIAAIATAFGLYVSGSARSAELIEHRVIEYSPSGLKDGYIVRIEVDDVNLSKGDCEALIMHYSAVASPYGQVSVRKPDKSGKMRPWCVQNLDETRGIFFNDFYFN